MRAAISPALASLLVAFDDSWLEYLDQFVVWKGRDAASLEQELMRMAVRLERSMRLKLGHRELDSPEVRANADLQVTACVWGARGERVVRGLLALSAGRGSDAEVQRVEGVCVKAF